MAGYGAVINADSAILIVTTSLSDVWVEEGRVAMEDARVKVREEIHVEPETVQTQWTTRRRQL